MSDAAEATTPKFCSKDWEDDGSFTFSFGNGEVVRGNVNEFSDDQKTNLMMHGLMQKIGDSYASAKGDFVIGIAAAMKVVDQLLNDQWVASKASSGEAKPRSGELACAIANLKKLDLATVTAAVDKASDEQRKAWRKHPAIAAEVARLRAVKAAERAAKAQGDATGAGDIDI